MVLDEVQSRFGQRSRVIDTLAGSVGESVDFFGTNRKPVRVSGGLALERPLVEGVTDVGQAEAADGAAGDGVSGGRENAVDDLVGLADVDEVRCSLDLVEVEWNLAGNGAVESGLEERGPSLLELVGTAAIVFANSGNSRIDALKNLRKVLLPKSACISKLVIFVFVRSSKN